MTTALLLSGGMDSLAVAWWKRPTHAITIDYGQRAAQAEKAASAAICKSLGIQHHVVIMDCRSLGSGDMVGKAPHDAAPASDWWPYRNQMLITFAVMKAISLGVSQLYIGTVRSDEGHRDGTTEFVRLINDLVRYQEGGIEVEAPAILLSTPELIKHADVPRELLAWAHSCHKANLPCNDCRGCNKYVESFAAIEE
jgi:7-cyano-7-deazaguanine synthase